VKKEQILEILLDYSPFWTILDYWNNRVKYTKKIENNIWSKLIKVLVWFRRSGKSYIFRYLINYLLNTKLIPKNNIFFLNLEDDRLYNNRNIKTLRLIYETYVDNINPKWKVYIFLDEIQLIEWWESFIRTIYEKNNDIEIFLTGSNSDLLSSEISSSLSGRFIEFKIFPLDFKEFLEFNSLTIKNELDYIRNKKEINVLFYRYIKFWWLPEILELNNDEQVIGYLKSVFVKIVVDDIVKRFSIRNIELLELLNKYLLTNIWWILSYKKIENAIRSYWYNISHLTLTEYISYIKKWFIIYDISKFDWKIKSIFNNFKKYYVLDLWIREVEKINFDNDLSSKLENLVFMNLLQWDNKMYYGQDDKQKEIDFIVLNNNQFDKYQIVSNLTQLNKDRELWNFVLWSKYISWKNYLITLDDSENIEYKWVKIEKINIIKWLLGFF